MSKLAAPKIPIGWHWNGDEDDPEFTHDKIKGKFTQLWLAEKSGSYWSFSDKMRLNSKPAGGKDVGIIDSSGALVGADGVVKSSTSISGGGSLPSAGIAPAKKWGAPAPAASKSASATAPAPAPAAPVVASLRMPEGWDKVTSGDTWFVNKTSSATCWFLYIQDSSTSYYNCLTGESLSTRPDAQEGSGIEIVDIHGNPAGVNDTDNGDVAIAPAAASTTAAEDELPEGWTLQTADDGAVFYYNSNTGETSWDRPIATSSVPIATSAVEVAATEDAGAIEATPLPAGWSQETAEDGAVFYYNSSSGETSWDRPSH